MAVGSHATKSKTKNTGEEVNSIVNNFYKPIEKAKSSSEMKMVDKVVKIFQFLNAFLENEEYYEACQDYITYLPE